MARCGPGEGQLTGYKWRGWREHCEWRRRHMRWLHWRRGRCRYGHLPVQCSDWVDWVCAARWMARKRRRRRWRVGSVGGVGSVAGGEAGTLARCLALTGWCHGQVLEVLDDGGTNTRAERAEKPRPLAGAQPSEKGRGHRLSWEVFCRWSLVGCLTLHGRTPVQNSLLVHSLPSCDDSKWSNSKLGVQGEKE